MQPLMQVDEIKAYMDCRWIGAAESCWQLFKFPMHRERPCIKRLAVHLEGEQVFAPTCLASYAFIVSYSTAIGLPCWH